MTIIETIDKQQAVAKSMITSGFELPGYRIVKNFGIVRGLSVRSRNLCMSIAGVCGILCGGRSAIFSELCEQTREEVVKLLCQHAAQEGANAIIGFQYDTSDLLEGVTEMIAYGTAVYVEPI